MSDAKSDLMKGIAQLREALRRAVSLHRGEFTSGQVLQASAELDRMLVEYQRLLLKEAGGPDPRVEE